MSNAILFVVCFVSFTWGIFGFFRVHGQKPCGTHMIQVVGGAMMLWHAVMLWQVAEMPAGISTRLAIGLYVLSLALFWSTVYVHRRRPPTLAFSEDAPEHLVDSGPYRLVRHPFYVSYLLAWVAGVVGTREPWLLLSVAVMGGIYLSAAMVEEQKFLVGALAPRYREYQRRTGMFVPHLAG